MDAKKEKRGKKRKKIWQFESGACIISWMNCENGVFTFGFRSGIEQRGPVLASFVGLAFSVWFVQPQNRPFSFLLFSLSSLFRPHPLRGFGIQRMFEFYPLLDFSRGVLRVYATTIICIRMFGSRTIKECFLELYNSRLQMLRVRLLILLELFFSGLNS